jgi:hypothetical protein
VLSTLGFCVSTLWAASSNLAGWRLASSYAKIGKALYTTIFAGMPLLIFTQLILRNNGVDALTGHWMHLLGTGWMVATLYLVLWNILVDIGKLLFRKDRRRTFYDTSKKIRTIQIQQYSGYTLTALLLMIGYYQYSNPKETVVDIAINKTIDGEKKSIKVVGISDVHLGYGTNKAQLQDYVKQINQLKPDLILISGDLIDNDLYPVYLQNMQEELNQLQAPLGIYLALGNHEYISNIHETKTFLKETSIQILQDSLHTLPNGIQLIGRDDASQRNRKSLASLMQGVNPLKPTIVIDHQPKELAAAKQQKVDLQFSGHTHKGQIWPVSLLVDQLFEVSYGLQSTNDTHIYVSSGLSLWGPPFRIGTRSEFVVFNLSFN